MKSLVTLLVFALLSIQMCAQLDDCRELFFSPMTEENHETIIAKAKPDAGSNPLLKAYQGASTASLAEFGFNIAKKFTLFNQGKGLIDEAVGLDPYNAEIRLLRLTLQLEAPGFLNYNDHIEEDKKLVLSWINGNNAPKGSFLISVTEYLALKKIL